MKVIVDGQIIDRANSLIDEKGWHGGTGIFETIRTVNGLPWALSRHMRRAVNSALAIGLKLPSEESVRELLPVYLAAQKHDLGMLRISFLGERKWAAVHLPYVELTDAAKLMSYSLADPMNGKVIKAFPYEYRLRILSEVKSSGFDEALVKNVANKITEGAVCNVLLKIAGQWFTPPLSDGVLPGVVRALVIDNCSVKVRSIDSWEVDSIEAAFLLSSLRLAQPVASIDGRQLLQSPELGQEIEAMLLRTSVG